MPSTQIDPAALASLSATPATLRTLVADSPEEALAAQDEGGWSARDVVAHLLDTQNIAFEERMHRIVAEDEPVMQLINPNERLSQYDSWTLQRLLDEFERCRAENVAFLRALPPDALRRTGRHAVAGDVSVADLANYCATHDLSHLAQLMSILRSRLAGHVGNMRRYFDEG